MNKKSSFNKDDNKPIENTNGPLTSECFTAYSSLKNSKNKLNIPKIILFFLLTLLLSFSVFIFALNIKRAFFSKVGSVDTYCENLNKIKTKYDNNDNIKVENVTDEIASLFGVPIGVRIVELDSTSLPFTGLKIDDIIVRISGKEVTTIMDINNIVDSLAPDDPLLYTVYRNGVYRTINPYDYEYDYE